MRYRIVTAPVLTGLFLVTVVAGRTVAGPEGGNRCIWDGNRAVRVEADNPPAGREFPTVRDTVAEDIPELPLPSVPASLRTPAARAGYVIGHFWDALDFADTLRTHDRDFMEQTFVNYLSLFPLADTVALRPAVAGLVGRVCSAPETLSLLLEMAGKYLYEQDSPMYDEEHYLLFADAFLSVPMRGNGPQRLKMRREAVLKNRVGTRAADFAFETLSGRRMRLSEFARGRRTLLLFYDPDCAHCMEVMAGLASSKPLRTAVESGGTAVLAVYAGVGNDGRELWRCTASKIPSSWTVGYDNGTVYGRDLYVLRNMPALYLLDAAGIVIAKNATSERIAGLLADP